MPVKRNQRTIRFARLVRNPDLLLFWGENSLIARDLRTGRETLVSSEAVRLLDFFGEPRRPLEAAGVPALGSKSAVARAIESLARREILVPEAEARRRLTLLRVWKNNLAAAHFHGAIRDVSYFRSDDAIREYMRDRLAAEKRPAPFKRYRSRFRKVLSEPTTVELASMPLGEALSLRRTVREFSREPVRFEDFAAVVGGTWGQTGWLTDRIIGRLVLKTSPSSGSLHSIECYVLSWNVQGLRAGLYHYDVASDGVRLLRPGNFRRHAVRAASGQTWIRRAAFLCVMAPVFTRNLWKYQWDRAYRSIWLDAGHLAQTFSLLATARGLGPFTTAAIQDSYIERLIGLDGVKEFPIYLCGAGIPAEPLLPLAR